MKSWSIFILIIILIGCANTEEVPEVPQAELSGHIFGGPSNDEGRAFLPAHDGGFWVIGNTESFGSGARDIWVIKTDSDMTEQWSNTYGGENDESVQSALLLPGSNELILSGHSGVFNDRNGHIYMRKLNSTGELIWIKTYFDGGWDVGGYVNNTSDGGFIITGSNNIEDSRSHFWLIKTDSSGNAEWQRTFGGTGSCSANSVSQTPDGGYLIYGEGTWDGSYDYSVWQGVMVKTDHKGKEMWHQLFGGPQSEEGYGSSITSDGSYVGVGYTNSDGFTGGYIAKADWSGSPLWFQQISDINSAFRVILLPDGGLILSGNSNNGLGFLNLDNDGNQIWIKYQEENGMSVNPFSLYRAENGYLYTAGYSERNNSGDRDIYVVRTDQNGEVVR